MTRSNRSIYCRWLSSIGVVAHGIAGKTVVYRNFFLEFALKMCRDKLMPTHKLTQIHMIKLLNHWLLRTIRFSNCDTIVLACGICYLTLSDVFLLRLSPFIHKRHIIRCSILQATQNNNRCETITFQPSI